MRYAYIYGLFYLFTITFLLLIIGGFSLIIYRQRIGRHWRHTMLTKTAKVRSPWEEANQGPQQLQCGQPGHTPVEKPFRQPRSDGTRTSTVAASPKVWHEGAD